jgi:hypothetical protein
MLGHALAGRGPPRRGGFVAYRVTLWLEIRKAHRSGDIEREQHLRRHRFGIYRWVVLCLLVFIVLLTALFWLSSADASATSGDVGEDDTG